VGGLLKRGHSYGRIAKMGVAWSWLETAGMQLIAIPTMMIMARLLSPAEFGVTAAAFFFLNLAQRFTQFGFNSALVRHKALREDHLNAVFYVSLFLGALAWLVLSLLAPAAADYFRSEDVQGVLRLAAVGFLIGPLATVPNALLARELRIQLMTKVGWASHLTNSIITIALAWRGFSFWSIVFGYLSSQLVASIGLLAVSGWRPTRRFSIAALRELLSFGLGIQAKRIIEFAALNLDNLVVGRLLGLASLGIYDKAFGTMTRVLSTVNTGGPGVSFRVFSLIQEQPERFRRAYRRVNLTVGLMVCPLFTWLGFVAPELFVLAFGEAWLPAAAPFRVLCVAAMLRAINTYASSVVDASGKVWAEVWRQCLYAASVVATVAFLSRWGVTGAALAVLGSSAMMTLLMLQLLSVISPLTWRDLLAPLAPGVVCAAGLSVILAALRTFLYSSWPALPGGVSLAMLGLAAVCYMLIFLLLQPFDNVREVIRETIDDFAPQFAGRLKGFSH